MSKLALFGGKSIRNKLFHPFPLTDKDDFYSITESFKENIFSGFRAGTYDGGPAVINFENHIANKFNTKYAVSFDTWSNGLISCLMSLGIEGGDEVITTAFTMSSCATSILACGALPIFADISDKNFCLDPIDIEKKISSKTKAILVVHLFGIPAPMDEIMTIAKKYNLYIIEDCAQSIMSKYKKQYCGTIGDVGGFSFTQSKFIMGGEGGCAITNNDKINQGLRVIRNHGEVLNYENNDGYVTNRQIPPEYDYPDNVFGTSGLIGFNFRMTELSASLINSQFKKLKKIIKLKHQMVNYLNIQLKDIPYIQIIQPEKLYDSEVSWYQYPLLFKEEIAGISRAKYVQALCAEGMNFIQGYIVSPLYKQSIYRSKPHWVIKQFGSHVDFYNPECPTTERLWSKELISTLEIRPPYTMNDMRNIVKAIYKVHENLDELK